MRGLTNLDRSILLAASNAAEPITFDADEFPDLTAAANRLIEEGRLTLFAKRARLDNGKRGKVFTITPDGVLALKLDAEARGCSE